MTGRPRAFCVVARAACPSHGPALGVTLELAPTPFERRADPRAAIWDQDPAPAAATGHLIETLGAPLGLDPARHDVRGANWELWYAQRALAIETQTRAAAA